MNKTRIAIALILVFNYLNAQRHEIGLSIGSANVVGDIGNESYVAPDNYSFQGFYKRNLNERYSLRLNVGYANLTMKDSEAEAQYRVDRNVKSDNKITEVSGIFEFNFFDFNGERRTGHTPYIFGGIGAVGHTEGDYNADITTNATTGNPSAIISGKTKLTYSPIIPFGLGYKVKVRYNWVVAAELGFRYTFSDNIDQSNPNIAYTVSDTSLTEDQIKQVQQDVENTYMIGNSNSKDWYTFAGISLAYTFGRPPCDCKRQ